MVARILVILFLIIILGIGFYFVKSGTVGKSSLLNFSLKSVFPTSTVPRAQMPVKKSTTYNNYYTPSQVPASSSVIGPAVTTTPTSTQPWQPPAVSSYDIPKGFSASELSPYFHKIRLGSVFAGSYNYYGQVSLYASFSSPASQRADNDEAINVSGWVLRANNGSQIVPRAVNIYDPSGLASETDVYLKSGNVLYIYTSPSAIGVNLRLNKCIGYLENTNHFMPSLPMNCPYVPRSEVSNFSGRCQDYIMSLGSCRLPGPNPPIPYSEDACRYYLDRLNYRGCFERYRSDPDFLGYEWRAWSGSRFLDERHDRILLLDKQGLLVDIYEY